MKMRKEGLRSPVLGIILLLALPAMSSGESVPLNEEMISPIRIVLTASKTKYTWEEPVYMQVSVYNCDKPMGQDQSCSEGRIVATQEGFLDRDWSLAIIFTAPDGTMVRSENLQVTYEPRGTFLYHGRNVVFVDLFSPGILTDFAFDSREDYALNQHGIWTAQVSVPLSIFEYEIIPTMGNSLDEPEVVGFYPPVAFFNPLKSNKVTFEIAPPEKGAPSGQDNSRSPRLPAGYGISSDRETPLERCAGGSF